MFYNVEKGTKGEIMQKENSTNEIIRVFRKFARLGLANENASPLRIYKKIEVLCPARRSRLDMLAVYDALRLLKLNGEDEVVEAVSKVYFEGMAYRLTKHEKGARVAHLANLRHCDERTVYRRLERARNLYEKIREQEEKQFDELYLEFY